MASCCGGGSDWRGGDALMYGWGTGLGIDAVAMIGASPPAPTAPAGACPQGMTYVTAWSLGGNTYPAQKATDGNMCMAPDPTCGQCESASFSAPNADGTITPGPCVPFPDAATLATVRAMSPAQLALFLAPASSSQQACINAALGISTQNTGTASFALPGGPVPWLIGGVILLGVLIAK